MYYFKLFWENLYKKESLQVRWLASIMRNRTSRPVSAT